MTELVQDGDCTLRDAVILSSVLSRTSIPVLHSSAALLKIAEMPYNGVSLRHCGHVCHTHRRQQYLYACPSQQEVCSALPSH